MPQHHHVEILGGGETGLETVFQLEEDHTAQPPQEYQEERAGEESSSISQTSNAGGMWFSSWLWNSGSLSSQQYLRVHGSLSNQCTFMDLEKLFIRVPHSILLRMLQEYRVLACC